MPTFIENHWLRAGLPYWRTTWSASVVVFTHASTDRAAAPIGKPVSLLSSTNSFDADANVAAVSASEVMAPATPRVGVFTYEPLGPPIWSTAPPLAFVSPRRQ